MVRIDDNIIRSESDLTAKQTMAWDTLARDDIKEVLYGGAKGGGKSVFGCLWCYGKALEIIRDCQIEERKHPIPIGFMGRKRGVDFSNTTLETWKRFIPEEMYEIKGKPAEIIIMNRVKILTGGLDNGDIVNKFNSAEYAFFFIDQAEEVDAAQIGELRATFRLIINGMKIRGKGLFTANPAPSFLKEEFILNPTPDRVFIKALPTDNSYLGDEYVEVLRDSFKNRPELLKAYLEGSWDSLGGFDQVIKDFWVTKCSGITLYPPRIKKLITCDPARFGNDETVIYYMENTEIKDAVIYGQKDTADTAVILKTMAEKYGNCLIAVDVCGLGAGVVDHLAKMGCNVWPLNNAERAMDYHKYYNLRAEVWCTAGDMFAAGDVVFNSNDRDLIGQLCSPRYEFRNGKILIEPKDSIKKRLGRSPDRADAYVNGLYVMQFLDGELIGGRDAYSDFDDYDDIYGGRHSAMGM